MCCVLLGPTGEDGACLSPHSLRSGHSRVVYSGWLPVSVPIGGHLPPLLSPPVCLQCPAPCIQPSVPVWLPSCSSSDWGSLDSSSGVLSLGCNSESEMLRRPACGTNCRHSAPAEGAQSHHLHSPGFLLTPLSPCVHNSLPPFSILGEEALTGLASCWRERSAIEQGFGLGHFLS